MTEMPPAKTPTGVKTAYVILSALAGMAEPLWKVVNDIEATSANTAIREHLRGEGIDAQTQGLEPVLFVAVPKRSWQALLVRVERTERLIVQAYEPSTQVAKPEAEAEAHLAPGDPGRLEMTAENDPERVLVPGSAQHEALSAVRTQALDIDPDSIPF